MLSKLYHYLTKTTHLELAITDHCNLACRFCSQASPIQKDCKHMSFGQIQRLSHYVREDEFYTVKISGGEPTLHPEFKVICRELRRMFQARQYVLATNGCRLEQYLDVTPVFDFIDLTSYPGLNDEVYDRLVALNLPNIVHQEKWPGEELRNVYRACNEGKHNIYDRCPYSRVKKVVQGRIYPCCVAFGESVRRGFDRESVSVPVDRYWRSALRAIDMDPCCQGCHVEVKRGGIFREVFDMLKARSRKKDDGVA